ncbi:hypothetical protein GCM10009127_29080 [Alteraurantiacibacter aestuarii]|uniref:Envelope stress response membrane protein PspB n=1 Tax=Alteraurantiacibacter aestuarii TaxID=650004 RepID=A0A844ZMM3_9SPHN|nr:hypothetical protein [Alteraurantiacibacter aestuarii]MXO89018.1 hypothetical protein [Alteraurantiacibacter aestuarii]
MSFGDPSFVVAIVGLSMGAWLISTWIRVKHGYPLDDGAGGRIEKSNNGEAQRLLETNRVLTERLENAEDRLAVLERIVTDEGYDTARKIEALRDRQETN